MADFYQIAGFVRVTGAIIDGCLIPIRGPDRDERLYVCHKGFHAINAMAVCDEHLSFTNFVCTWHGSVHDSAVFNASNLHVNMEGWGGRNGWPLGDRGYGIQPYLMTPLRPESVFTVSQNSYQKAPTKTRNTMVMAFRLWKTRFQSFDCSGGALQYQLNRCCTIITATAVLHNMRIFDNKALPANVDDPPVLADFAADTLIADDNAAGSVVTDQLINDVFGSH